MSFDIRDHTIPAGGMLPIQETGKYFVLLEAGGNVNVTFKRANSTIGNALNIDAPFSIGPMLDGMTGVELTAVSGAETVVKIGITDDPVDYLRVSGVVSINTGSTASVSKVTASNVSDVLLAADATRRSAVIINTSTTDTVYIDTAAAVAGTGFPIYPRQSVTIDKAPQSAWNVIRGGTNNVDLRIIEEND